MANVTGPPANVTRNKPIMPRLKIILSDAADAAGIDHVRISSGGQDAKGHGTRRTGSIRHDLGGAADLELLVEGHVLNFQNAAERATVAKFVTECSRRGATGIGAGGLNGPYMGPTKLHVGFGTPATWGHGGKSVNAPKWLLTAVKAASGAAPPAAGPRTLKRGDTGPDVERAQRALGMVLPASQYGTYGPKTEARVRKYQTEHHLDLDGKFGRQMREALGL